MTNYTEKVYLLLDVGGTQIKGAVFDEEGNRKIQRKRRCYSG